MTDSSWTTLPSRMPAYSSPRSWSSRARSPGRTRSPVRGRIAAMAAGSTSVGGGRRWANASCEALVGWSTATSIARSSPSPVAGSATTRRRLDDGGIERLHVAEQEAVGVRRRREQVGLGARERERLLAQHRQPAVERGEGVGAVRAGGQEEQPVEAGQVEQLRHATRRADRGGTAYRSPMASRRAGDRSQSAAISNASARRASSGRWTAWATAPRPATPTRSRPSRGADESQSFGGGV